MSGPVRMRIGPALSRLRERIEEARPIVDAQERNAEGIEFLRKTLVKIKRGLNFIEERNEEWRVYMASLVGKPKGSRGEDL